MKALRYKTAYLDWVSQKGFGSDQEARIILYFDDKLNIEIMEKALHAITYIDPILGCAFIQGERRSYWQRREDIDSLKLGVVIETENSDKEVSAFTVKEADYSKETHVRTAIIREKGKGDILCLVVDHVIADGGGAKEIAYLIADTYNKILENPHISFEMSSFKKRTIIGLLRSAGEYRAPKLTNEDIYSKLPLCFNMPFMGQKPDEPGFSIREIGQADFNKLKNFSKSNNATINDLILTALIRTMCEISEVIDDTSFFIHVSGDIRGMLPKSLMYSICNIFSIMYPEFTWNKSQSFLDTLVMVSNKMKEEKKKVLNLDMAAERCIELSYRRKAIIKRRREYMKMLNENPKGLPKYYEVIDNRAYIILSNFGAFDEERLRFKDLKIKHAVEMGTISYHHDFMLCASAFNNVLTISTGFCQGIIEKCFIDKILNNVINELFHCIED